MFGGDDELNGYVNGYVKTELAELDITLNQVKINDTAEAVNKVLGEISAGKTDGGSVDLIWINGENFATLKQADAVECGYVEDLPSTEERRPHQAGHRHRLRPAHRGLRGAVAAGHQLAGLRLHRAHRGRREERRVAVRLVAGEPGRFTYPAPPDFTGSMAVRTFFFDAAGGADQFLGDFDEAKYDAAAPKLWERLNAVEPSLWRGGSTYPASGPEVRSCSRRTRSTPSSPTARAASAPRGEGHAAADDAQRGLRRRATSATTASPRSRRTPVTRLPRRCWPTCCCRPEAALVNAGPEGAGFTSAIDLSRLPAAQRASSRARDSPYQVPPAELAAKTLPEVTSDYVNQLEKDWKANVLQSR
jgi:putative spermidine/putrescine transport system substrate-binding protein